MDKTERMIAEWREEGIEMIYPLVFGFRTSVLGEGWVAGVELCGAAVVTKEESEYIAHGLKPGGVAAVGSTLTEAYLAYKEEVQAVLYDMAGAVSFDAFREGVLEFFESADAWGEEKFAEGRLMVAAGKVESTLPVEPNPELEASVVELELRSKNNPVLPAGGESRSVRLAA